MEIPGYRVERRIAEGGMSSVYLAVQRSLDRQVVLKVLKRLDSREYAERLLAEARTVAAFRHPHIITIHDVGRAGDRYYIAMEYVEGDSLQDRIDRGITPGTALDLLEILADCLQYVHARQVVHGDIKPSNILFHADGRPKLSDFGIASRLDAERECTKRCVTLGSPHYLCPEQAEGQPLDGRSDIYALGIVFYQMLTGRLPYAGESHLETIVAHLSQPIPLLPEELSRYQGLLDGMLAKRPEGRFASAADLIAAIRRQRRSSLHSIGDAMARLGRAGVAGLDPVRESLPRIPVAAGVAAIAVVAVTAAGLMLHAPGPEGSSVEVASVDAGSEKRQTPSERVPSESERVGRPVSGLPLSPPLAEAVASERPKATGTAERQVGPVLAPRPAATTVAQKPSVIPGPEPVTAAADGAERPQDEELKADTPLFSAGPSTTETAGTALPLEQPDTTDADRTVLLTAVEQAGGADDEAVPAGGASGGAVADQAAVDQGHSEADKVLTQWMQAGDRALRANRLTTPVDDSAFTHYGKVLELDPEHAGARSGMDRIADRYVVLARKAMKDRAYQRAELYVQRGLRIRGDHNGLQAVHTDIIAAQQIQVAQRVAAAERSRPAPPPDDSDSLRGREGTGNIFKDFGNVLRSIFD